MGDVVDLKRRVVIAEQFHHVQTLDTLGRHELVLARSMHDGVPHLSLLLTNLPEGQGFEILATFREDNGGQQALEFMAKAVWLACVHVMSDSPVVA